MSELRLPPNAGHLRGNEVVATILDLVTPAAQCAQVLTPIVGRNVVDVVPVEALALDPAARRVLAHRFPDVPIHPDVQELT